MRPHHQHPQHQTQHRDERQPPTTPPVLTSGLQLCLAHYCDLHGPTPLMVTEGLPAPCSTCFDEAELQDRPPTSAPTSVPSSVGQATAAIADAMRKMNMHGHRNSSLSMSEQEAQISRAALLRNASSPAANTTSRPSTSAIETPPESPRRVSEQPAPRRESSNFRRTYDDNIANTALGSAISKQECTVINIGDPDGPPRLLSYLSSSQGYLWNPEIFLPPYVDCDYEPIENRRDPVHDIVLTDEESKSMLPQ
ncbi:conserved hypothetical protein [Verticillium alfalfae VaMs.102]|uniref:Uncharacterized protein n=1 Tax=Verticillium alfalfae (strain VaMs.102 / ATCC MYA-4576 / FGSC 10136) TaxID=526221 RepID=C9SGK4_VERA1|nr:conserved hypothetical protein [Verticillium alfalfae VaMs.102]EEY17521.1 conserved hypothetical protein [Verticillium alfalfae VaMs.102]